MNERLGSSLSEQLPTAVAADGTFTFAPTETWTQGRTLFGGIIAAAGLRALSLHVGNGAPARTVTTTFEKPIAPGPVHGQCVVHHAGKRVTTAAATFSQDGEVKTRVHIVFGAARASKISVSAPVASRLAEPDSLEKMPYVEGFTPVFTQHVDFRWAPGPYPFSGSESAPFRGYCRWNEAPPRRDEGILALLDAWPAPVLALATGAIPASSVTWTAHLFSHHDAEEAPPPPGYCWMEAETLRAEDGYATSIAKLHDDTGRLVAWGEQLVAYFD